MRRAGLRAVKRGRRTLRRVRAHFRAIPLLDIGDTMTDSLLHVFVAPGWVTLAELLPPVLGAMMLTALR